VNEALVFIIENVELAVIPWIAKIKVASVVPQGAGKIEKDSPQSAYFSLPAD